jgi:predicted metal-dependent peptidase
MKDRKRRVESAQTRVVLRLPFFAPGLLRLPVEFDDSGAIPTAATDGKRIIWSGKWFDSLPDGVLPTVLCHEVAHCLYGHLWRGKDIAGLEHGVWNQAVDHAVNTMLKEFSAQTMGKGLADPFPFPDPQDAYCADPAYAGWAEERIYHDLMAKPKQSGGKGQKRSKAGASGGQGGQPDPHSMPDFGQILPPGPGQAGSKPDKQLRQQWQDTLIQSVNAVKGRGDLPGDLSRMVKDLTSSKLPWWEILRSYLRELASDDWNFQHPALEWSDCDFILPSLRSEKVGSVVFGSDWSGSTCGLMEQFHAEKQSCLDDLKPRSLIDIGFDTEIGWEKEYFPGETINTEVKCGGGTCFRAFFARCEAMQPQPKVVVVLTDLDGSMPDCEPPFPVIWVRYGNSPAPWGTVIDAEQAQ